MTARPDRPRTPALVGAALLVAALVAGCQGEPDTPSPAPPATQEPEPTEEPEPTAEPTDDGEGTQLDVPAYFMVDTRAGLRLARETAQATGNEPVKAAVEAMIAGPQDPDYSTPWASGTRVLGISSQDGGFTVDLSAEALEADIGSEGAMLMVQQLVWTVTHAADDPDATVMLHVDGEPAGDLWGTTTWTEPVGRDDAIGVRLLTQIDDPADGATVTSPVTVSGEAAVFEATLLWSVLDASGTEVESGFTSTTEGQTFAPYSFDLDLEPGEYTVVVSESDPSDGEAGTPMTDSRRITVE